ncbi:MAG: glycosyltransferase [Sulfuricella sp.]|nr:glycosyltransferase [Sulfuricella sp.]
MKIAIFARDLGPVGHLRLLDPLRFLGHDVQYCFVEISPGVVTTRPGILEWADVLVVQRDFPGPDLAPICAALLATRKPLVYETDDIVWAFDTPQSKQARPHILKIIAAARLVTVSTPVLAQEISQFNRKVTVLPNYLNDRLWTPHIADPRERKARRVKIGYVGSADHFHDINDLRPALVKIVEKYPNVDLCFMGCKPNAIERLKHVSCAEADFDYEAFPEKLARMKLDIGLAPLRDTHLNRCRSPIKFLDYSLVGAACVASANSTFDSVVRNGENGFLCESPSEWFETLSKLVEDKALRRNVARSGQEEVLGNWMLSAHADLWETAYRKVLGG